MNTGSCQTGQTAVDSKYRTINNLCVLSALLIKHMLTYAMLCTFACKKRLEISTPSSSTNTAARRFSCCAPTAWNSLPSFVRIADSFTSFRSQLKTYVSKTFVAASDTLTRSFARYKFVSYLLIKQCTDVLVAD